MKLHTPSLIAFLISCASIAPVSGETLLLHYTYDEQGRPTADSGTGTAANGSLYGSNTLNAAGSGYTNNTPSGSGYAYSSDGGTAVGSNTYGSYINAGDANKLDGLTGLTFSTWINLQSDSLNPDRLVSKEGTNSGFYASIANVNTTNHTFNIAFSFNGVSSSPLNADYRLTANNTWLFIAFTYDATVATNNLKVYAGTSASAVSLVWTASNAGGTTFSNSIVANSSGFDINASPVSGGDRSANAFFDDTRVYSGVLDLAALDAVRLTQVSSVPEPSTYALWFGMAAVGAAASLRLRRHQTN